MTTPQNPQRRDRPVEAASAAPGERRAASPNLGRASESGHPDVHKALGDVYTAEQNLAAAKREGVEDPDAEASLKDARKRLRDLGVE